MLGARVLRFLLRFALIVICASLAGSCKCSHEAASVPPKTPTVRLYLVSSPAGALEPCGCVKDMLGGVDHLAAFVKSQSADAPHSALLGAGPMFFMNTALSSEHETQDAWKADALARSLGAAGLRAWAPGANDWAGGADTFNALANASGASPLAANLKGPTLQAARVFEVGGTKVGVAGISLPLYQNNLPTGISGLDALGELQKAKASLDSQGARLRVLLTAMPRGDALRLIDRVPGFHVLVIGKPFDQGESNDRSTPPEVVGSTLVVEAPNHLQALGVVDLFVRDDKFEFADGSNTAAAAERESLTARIAELDARISAASNAGKTADTDQARLDLERMKAQEKALSAPSVPAQGSFFQYRLVNVRDSLGTEQTVQALMDGYYQRVNDHNRDVFKDKLPLPAPAGQSHYVGVEVCTTCHKSEREFWNRTQHSAAYATLSSAHKEFNLDCVSCHVTGYDKPGGSTVVHVEKLSNVQCEVCHGPGSRHVETPLEDKSIAMPEQGLCASQCHHQPHVKADWSVTASWAKIIGPGHQRGSSAPSTPKK
ncbi:MAG TPA: multiheme c-type cytochrome [Polyangiaceae bacterium]|nr:multiheme c-type cytochrome [Polyangiaceae bacterium]